MKTLASVLADDGVSLELIDLISTITETASHIAQQVNQGALANVLGEASTENIQGETQKNLDVIANNLLKTALLQNAAVRALASEEEDFVVPGNNQGGFVVAFDPLDGSSNIDINGLIGTIFTIYPAIAAESPDSEAHFLQGGAHQVCAGYILYSAATLLVISTGGPTQGFTLNADRSAFLLTHPKLQIAADTQEFSANMANQRFWSEGFTRYIGELIRGEEGVRQKRFNMRWNAAMVGDVHRVILRGGVFLYPRDNRDPQQPAKLRLLYEANPMAMLVENAGGKAFTESQTILSVQPTELHQRVPVILGSCNEVDICIAHLASH